MSEKILNPQEAVLAYIKTQLEGTDMLMVAFYNELNINNDDPVRNSVRSCFHDIHASVAKTVAEMEKLNQVVAQNNTTLTEVFKKAKAAQP